MKTEAENTSDRSAEAAASWARRCAGGMSAAERAEFKAWLAEDAGHARALARANRGGVDADWAWQSGAVDEILVGVASRVRRQRHRRAAFAGVAALLMVAALALRPVRQPEPAVAAPAATTLAIIRPVVQTLPDGSVVELKDDARISIDFSGALRVVSLSHGTAYFQVARDPSRPFVVKAAGLSVQAVGTAFTVELDQREIKVVVAEGSVRVDPSGETISPAATAPAALVSLDAGSSAVIPLSSDVSTAPTPRSLDSAEMLQQLGWRIPKLEFTRTPLREVIAQMNQYNARKFVLADESLGDVRVSGVLRADKMDTLADTLESDFDMRTERRAGEIVLRRAK